MGLYTKGLEMPKNCDVCPISPVYLTCGCDKEHCMIQDVKEPHGRLIDADALLKEAHERLLLCAKYENEFQKPYEILRTIELAPIIIPEEQETEP